MNLNVVDMFDSNNKHHAIDVQVLAAEDTWDTPSLILATAPSGGKVIFSQVRTIFMNYNHNIKITSIHKYDNFTSNF